MKLRYIIVAAILAGATPVLADGNTNALRREIAYIEAAADELMKLALEVDNRPLRRRIASQIDELYEAAERMRLLISEEDTVPKAIREEDLESFIRSLENASFSEAKVDMIREFSRSNWFSVEQVGRIVEKVAFGDDKVNAILILYPHMVDPENSYRLYEFVTFSDDRERLKKGLDELGGG